MAFLRDSKSGYEDVQEFHLNSDVDESPIALHHTLGVDANQAAAGDHNHNGRNSRRVQLNDLVGVGVEYTPIASTSGTQPVMSPSAIAGSYIKWGSLVFFSVHVEFATVTNFGTGQYQLTLPFKAKRHFTFRDGCLHPSSSGTQFHTSGHVDAGSDLMILLSSDKVSSGIQDVAFSSSVPATLSTSGNFHISGTYEIDA